MLRDRVLTALVLAAVVLLADFYLDNTGFALFVALPTLLGAHEWARLAGLSRPGGVMLWLSACVAAGLALYLLPSLGVAVLTLAAVAWLLAGVWLFSRRTLPAPGSTGARLLAGLVVLVPSWYALVRLHAEDPWLVILLLAVVAIADIGAYFTGRAWGRRKLAPMLSPGKTVEGLAGALLGVLLFVVLITAGAYSHIPFPAVLLWCLATAGVSIVGDLLESFMKRTAGVKDSGSLLPGHGGVLDRIDSISAAAPVFAIGWLLGMKTLPSM